MNSSCGHNHSSGNVNLRSIASTAQQLLGSAHLPVGEPRPEHSKMSSDENYPQRNFEPVGNIIRNIAVDRLRQLTSSGQYAGVNLRS